jgi:ABC-type lipoprotein release transport system permease subunit
VRASWVWAQRDAARRWRGLLAVALLAGLCGGLVLAAVAGARRAGSAVDRYVAHTGDPHVLVFSGAPVDPEVRADLQADGRVSAVLPTELGILFPAGGEPGRDIGVLTVETAAAASTPWRPWLRAGRLPAAGAADEIAVSEATADVLGLGPGDTVPLAGVTTESLASCFSGDPQDCPTTPSGEALVTGVFRYTVDLGGEPDDERMILADQALLDARPSIGRAYLLMAWTHRREDVNAVVDDFAVRVPEGDVTAGDDTLPGVRRATEVQHGALLVAAVVVAVAGLAVVGPAYGRYLAQRRGEVGVLSALGMVRGERAVAGALPGLIVAPAAGAWAVTVAVVLSPLLPLGVARRADPDAGLHADGLVLGAGAVLVALAVAALFAGSAWRWSRQREGGVDARAAGASGWLRALAGISPPARVGAGMAVDAGTGSRRLPVLPVLTATAAAVGVVVAALVVSASLTGLLATPARFGAPWDLQVAPADPSGIDALIGHAVALDGVRSVATAAYGELQVRTAAGDTTELGVVGMENRQGDVAPTVLRGEPIRAADEVLVGATTAERLSLEPGDPVTLAGPSGTGTARVAGVTILPDIGAATVDDGLVVPRALFDRLGATDLVDPIDAQVVALVQVDGDRRADVTAAIAASGGLVARPLPSPQSWSLRDVRPVTRLLALATAALAALAAFHALATGVRRRRRDLGVLRALGFTAGQTASAVRWQSVTIAAITTAVAVPLGVVAGRLVWRAVVSRVRVVDATDVPVGWLALLVLVLLAGSIVVAALPARRATRLRPAEVLRDE